MRQFRIADDSGKNVVKIMGDAAGQGADGFHFLGHAQPFFQCFSLGDVLDCTETTLRFYRIHFAEICANTLGPDNSSVRVDNAKFLAIGAAFFDSISHRLVDMSKILRMNVLEAILSDLAHPVRDQG